MDARLMAASVTVHGVRNSQRLIYAVAERASNQTAVMLAEATRVRKEIRGVPRDTGRLDRGVHGGSESILNAKRDGYELGTSVPYSRFVFKGTQYVPAQPITLPPDIGASCARAVSNDLDRVR